uniref:Large ribosomal subunit protein uL15 n=1 Tax=Candidatus Aschnera chinzeii TaxID=1485666 RepID=A0AAT9G471_9ENTR|nr:MAG: 50S ribosomal protein L15 [Candidatus Aschnera chinzeii]
MFINTIASNKNAIHKSKRVGRGVGSGHGKTSGRGHKGQKSRSGKDIRRGFEGGQTPIYRRLPKFGFKSSKTLLTQEVRLSELSNIKSNLIDINILKKHNIINDKIKYVKIILSGKINHKIIIRGIRVTKGVRSIIESIGGKIEE